MYGVYMTDIKLSRRFGEKWCPVCGCGLEWMAANDAKRSEMKSEGIRVDLKRSSASFRWKFKVETRLETQWLKIVDIERKWNWQC